MRERARHVPESRWWILLNTPSRAVAALLVLVLATAGSAIPASATTLSDKRAQAKAAQARLDGLRNKAEQAAESYNEANAKYSASRRRFARPRYGSAG
jgi:hypothetical protein